MAIIDVLKGHKNIVTVRQELRSTASLAISFPTHSDCHLLGTAKIVHSSPVSDYREMKRCFLRGIRSHVV